MSSSSSSSSSSVSAVGALDDDSQFSSRVLLRLPVRNPKVLYRVALACGTIIELLLIYAMSARHRGWFKKNTLRFGWQGQSGAVYSASAIKTGGGIAFFFLLLAAVVQSLLLVLLTLLGIGNLLHRPRFRRLAYFGAGFMVPATGFAWFTFLLGAEASVASRVASPSPDWAFGITVLAMVLAVCEFVTAMLANTYQKRVVMGLAEHMKAEEHRRAEILERRLDNAEDDYNPLMPGVGIAAGVEAARLVAAPLVAVDHSGGGGGGGSGGGGAAGGDSAGSRVSMSLTPTGSLPTAAELYVPPSKPLPRPPGAGGKRAAASAATPAVIDGSDPQHAGFERWQ